MRNPHERQVTAGAHAAERLVESHLVAHRFDDAVGPQAAGQFLDACNALLAALLLLACLSIPWLAMASTPVRVTGPSAAAQIDPRQIDKSVSMGVSMSVSIRLGTCLALVILTPILCSTSQGIALSALIGAALMLSTRSIRSRVEVLIGVLSGMAVLAWAAYAAALQSASSLLLVLVTSLTGSLLVLATNVVTPKTRPWLSRTADTISTLVIIAVPPFALYMWGM